MKSQALLCASLISIALLQACGGGSNSDGFALPAANGIGADKVNDNNPATVSDSGSVSTPFVRGATARYMLLGVGLQSFSRLTDSEQAASGAMTKLNDTTLGGSSVTQDIHGDADFALGRWVAGTVTRASGADTLTGNDNRAYHYVALNALAEMPAAGSPTCDAGVFTAPTYTGGGSGPQANSGTASGSASLSFSDQGGTVGGVLNVSVGDATASTSLDNITVATPTSVSMKGAFLSGGSGAAVQLGAHGTDGYVIAAGYAVTLATGARYTGIAKFSCS